MIDQTLFADVYDVTTGLKQRVPREWLDDPVLGRNIRKTPSQRELDGELPARPVGDAKAKDIEAYAEAAGLDLSGAKSNADKLVAIEQAMGPAPFQGGVVEVDVAPAAADPLAPAVAAHSGEVQPVLAPDQTSDDTESTDQTPADGDKE